MSVVLITGCSSGFGLASAIAFARNGDTVYASMRDTSKGAALQQCRDTENLDIRILELDVTKSASFAGLVGSIVASSGRLDVLVNNAGIIRSGALEDQDEPGLRAVVETNLFAPLLLTKAVLPQMRAQRGGYIIMISSLSGIAGLPGDVVYTASKFALEGASEALRHEVDRWGINIALVEAGGYATRIFESSVTKGGGLPAGYPENSPYRALVEYKARALRERLAGGLNPTIVAELLVRISQSDGSQLRWPADATARMVLTTMFGLDDTARDTFLRAVSGTDWWSKGSFPPVVPQ